MNDPHCPVETTLEIIGGKWKTVILFHLQERTLRFSELKRSIPAITQKMLAQQLRELEQDGILHRKVYPQVPPKVEYRLTDLGISLAPIIEAMRRWGKHYQTRTRGQRPRVIDVSKGKT